MSAPEQILLRTFSRLSLFHSVYPSQNPRCTLCTASCTCSPVLTLFPTGCTWRKTRFGLRLVITQGSFTCCLPPGPSQARTGALQYARLSGSPRPWAVQGHVCVLILSWALGRSETAATGTKENVRRPGALNGNWGRPRQGLSFRNK